MYFELAGKNGISIEASGRRAWMIIHVHLKVSTVQEHCHAGPVLEDRVDSQHAGKISHQVEQLCATLNLHK